MQTKPIDALRLWWRDINFTQNQRRALGAVAVFSIALSAILIFHPYKSLKSHKFQKSIAAIETRPTIVIPPMLVVDVTGEVKIPGVYELPPNSRVIDALKAAGGAKKSADLTLINLARVIKDGEQIYIDKKDNNWTSNGAAHRSSATAILNINRASAKELESLPGIGPVLATRIIEYRKVNGPFLTVDELQKVPGIGGSKLSKFKAKIRV